MTDGSSHPADSNEVAYKIAASIAFKDAYRAAGPALLEPIMKIEVAVPTEFLGEVLADLNARKGHIEAIDDSGSAKAIRASAPLRAIFGYATSLRSLTQGRGSYIIEPLYYQPVAPEELEKIVHR